MKYLYVFIILFVHYEYANGQFEGCQDTMFNAECQPGSILYIQSVFYGRQDDMFNSTHLDCINTDSKVEICFSDIAYLFVAEKCDGKQNCSFAINSTNLDEPCPNTQKYLIVNYTCINETSVNLNCNLNEMLLIDPCKYDRLCPGQTRTTDCKSFGCSCRMGFRRDSKSGMCVGDIFCPQPGNPVDNHEMFSICANYQNACPGSFFGRTVFMFPYYRCVPGYLCIPPYVRNGYTDKCVLPYQCVNPFKWW